jgi:hypothetical protein
LYTEIRIVTMKATETDNTNKPAEGAKAQPAPEVQSKLLEDARPSTPESFKGAVCKPSIQFIDRVASVVSSCEGCFTSVNWNDAGHGISVGKAQWNQKRGEMPDLYDRWAEKDPARFKAVFGKFAVKMRDENWLREAHITPQSEIGTRILKSLNEPSMQETQTDMLREKAQRAVRLAAEYNHHSELFVAQVADVANQMGWTGARRALERSKAADIADEQLAVKALQDATKKRVNSHTRDAKLIGEFSHERKVDLPT